MPLPMTTDGSFSGTLPAGTVVSAINFGGYDNTTINQSSSNITQATTPPAGYDNYLSGREGAQASVAYPGTTYGFFIVNPAELTEATQFRQSWDRDFNGDEIDSWIRPHFYFDNISQWFDIDSTFVIDLGAGNAAGTYEVQVTCGESATTWASHYVECNGTVIWSGQTASVASGGAVNTDYTISQNVTVAGDKLLTFDFGVPPPGGPFYTHLIRIRVLTT